MLLRSIVIPFWILQLSLLTAAVVTTFIIAHTVIVDPDMESPSLAYDFPSYEIHELTDT